MSRIEKIFTDRSHKALIPFVTTGYPDIETTLKIVLLLARSGADIIELGVPFSDPLADGVTIQRASFKAIENGVTTRICLEVVKQLREKIDTPLVFMSYFNPLFQYGLERFCRDCGKAGVDGLIIPDLPPEEGVPLEEMAHRNGVDVIYLLAPTSTDERIKLVVKHSRGFVYLVSVTGVTGARSELPQDLAKFIGRVRKFTDKPLCVGFGIATPEQARRVAELADGVIVGSRLIQSIEEDPGLRAAANLVKEMRAAIDSDG
ncbi:MAG: tryptophan synthase subunit alpha [Dehalococcoidia bacterium]|nr:tryptophan synthase subunit alpha [Dehalococcoidia bacterium]